MFIRILIVAKQELFNHKCFCITSKFYFRAFVCHQRNKLTVYLYHVSLLLVALMKANIVGTVLILSLLLWIPVSCVVCHIVRLPSILRLIITVVWPVVKSM